MSNETFERGALDGKDREQLQAIAGALGLKAVSRLKKAELVEAILGATNGASNGGADAGRRRSGAKPRKIRSTRRRRAISMHSPRRKPPSRPPPSANPRSCRSPRAPPSPTSTRRRRCARPATSTPARTASRGRRTSQRPTTVGATPTAGDARADDRAASANDSVVRSRPPSGEPAPRHQSSGGQQAPAPSSGSRP